jgi:hypothetical protein
MSFDSPILLAALGLIVLIAVIGFSAYFFSPEAKLGRRRRRNNCRVVSKARRPIVTLSVKTKKH